MREGRATGPKSSLPRRTRSLPDRMPRNGKPGSAAPWPSLPEHQRIPLVLYHFDDLPYEEIAARLRVSLAKVKTDILRARAALARILARSGTPHETLSP